MKYTLHIIILFLFGAIRVAAGEPDFSAEIAIVDQQIQASIERISPTLSDQEADVRARFGRPRGMTTPELESKHGDYDIDKLGLYRWFYRTDVYREEKESKLQTVFSVEMVVYFIAGKVAGSTIEISPGQPRRYLSSNGVVESHSGAPPVLRRGPNNTLHFDFHTEEGLLDSRKKLRSMLEHYETSLKKEK